ncbi:uncharacterized protein LOC134402235 isoform X2 [Elgaria multicarinata webbii]|uniref:uncharacterized protein LOC134402235 isoform X2 n=1 Tax=Elgaria multicarinata webbii TaxID=159646 RepID=UPI002FCD621E
MPSKKGIGGKKGKGKAPRPPAKRTRSRSGSSSDDGDRPDFSAFLARLQAAELERGIVSPQVVPSPATGTGGVGRSLTRKQSQERLWSSISARLDAIEASSSSNAQSQPHSNREDTSNTPQTPASGPSVAMPANSNQLSPGILQPPLSGRKISGAGPLGEVTSRSYASGIMGDWQEEVDAALWQSLAPRTRAAYRKANREFQIFGWACLP